jgi:hypothetical protein
MRGGFSPLNTQKTLKKKKAELLYSQEGYVIEGARFQVYNSKGRGF